MRRRKSDRKGDVERGAGRQAEKGKNERTEEKQEKRRDDEQGKRTRRKKRTRKESTARRKNERESGQAQKKRRVQERQGARQGRDTDYYLQECLENSDYSEYIRTFNRRISTVSPASQAFRGNETSV